MSIVPIAIFSGAIGVFGILFLVLSLAAAYRQVFPPTERTEHMRDARSVEEITSLLTAVDNVKTWLALAVVGTTLLLVASSAPALERLMGVSSHQSETQGEKRSAPKS